MSDMKVIEAFGKKITVRPWADGKLLLISADEEVKSEMIRLRAEENGILELLTDPDLRVVSEDMEGPMMVVADPERFVVTFDLKAERIAFAECVIAEETDDE